MNFFQNLFGLLDLILMSLDSLFFGDPFFLVPLDFSLLMVQVAGYFSSIFLYFFGLCLVFLNDHPESKYFFLCIFFILNQFVFMLFVVISLLLQTHNIIVELVSLPGEFFLGSYEFVDSVVLAEVEPSTLFDDLPQVLYF